MSAGLRAAGSFSPIRCLLGHKPFSSRNAALRTLTYLPRHRVLQEAVMTSLNSSHLRKTFILVVGLVLCLVSSAFAGGGGGGGSINLMMGKTLAGGAATGFAEGVPAQNVAITPNGVATDAMGNVYVGNGTAVLKIDARMRTISTVAGAPGGSAAAGYVGESDGSVMLLAPTSANTLLFFELRSSAFGLGRELSPATNLCAGLFVTRQPPPRVRVPVQSY